MSIRGSERAGSDAAEVGGTMSQQAQAERERHARVILGYGAMVLVLSSAIENMGLGGTLARAAIAKQPG